VAFAVWALWLAIEARRAPPDDDRRVRRRAVGAGVLAGLALLYRPDLIVALGAGLLIATRGAGAARLRRRLAAGTLVGLAPYAVHLATAGVTVAFRGMVLDPVVYLRGGRRLPIPPNPHHIDGFLGRSGDLYPIPWPVPALPSATELTVWFFLMFLAPAVLVLAGIRLSRRQPGSIRARVLLTVGVFSIGLLPQGVQRADAAHLAWATCVSFGFLPAALFELVVHRTRLRPVRRRLAAGLAVVFVLVTVMPHFFGRNYVDYVVQTAGRRRIAYRVHYNGRTFYYGRYDVLNALHELFAEITKVTSPGDRLFVGTSDLRKTPYSEAFIYYMFPELRPATYFIEMDPGVANRKGSRLADDVASADAVVLSSVWDVWDEPNDSRKLGPDRPNQVVREQFELHGEYGGLYKLYVKRRD
jgi:hypothetical protein